MANKNNSLQEQFKAKEFWLHLWRLLEPVQKNIKRLAALLVVVELVKFVAPYLLKLIVDSLNGGASNAGKIFWLILGIFLTYQALSMLNYKVDNLIFKILLQGDKELIMGSFRKMIFLHLGFHEKENTGSKVSKIDRGVGRISELISAIGWEVGPTIIQIALTLPILFLANWMFGLVVLLFMPIFILLTLRVNKMNFPKRIERHNHYEKASGLMAQSIININTVKSFVQEERECNRLKKSVEGGHKVHFLEFANITRFNLARNLVIDTGRALILLSGLYLTLKGMLTVGSLIFVYTISEKALLSLYRITRLYDKIMDSSEAVERLHQLAKEPNKIHNAAKPQALRAVSGEIAFENVSFHYDSNQEAALKDVKVRILPGSVAALVGPSGGGKTTFVRMIFRHYDPSNGKVMFDGKDIRQLNLFEYRKQLAIVPQEVEIFNLSIRENIAYAKPKASLAEIKAAARIANAEEFILKLDKKYETLVGERGIKLSGGQRQRIGIARAILANPKVLIFDEATSNLDSYSEKLIQEALEKICKNRTVILIAHRLSTIRKADKIIVLEHGKVIEQGSHAELSLKDGGLYQKLLALQRMGDVD